MNALNQIIIEGHVADKVTYHETDKYPSDDFPMAVLPISVERNYKTANGETITETSLFDVEAYGTLAETIMEHAHENRGIRVVGRLKQKKWTDSDGIPHNKTVIIAEYVEFKYTKSKGELPTP